MLFGNHVVEDGEDVCLLTERRGVGIVGDKVPVGGPTVFVDVFAKTGGVALVAAGDAASPRAFSSSAASSRAPRYSRVVTQDSPGARRWGSRPMAPSRQSSTRGVPAGRRVAHASRTNRERCGFRVKEPQARGRGDRASSRAPCPPRAAKRSEWPGAVSWDSGSG